MDFESSPASAGLSSCRNLGVKKKISKTNVCQSRSCWEEPGLQEQLGVCDTEMSPANFRGAESRRKDILLELSVDFLAQLGANPADLPIMMDHCSLTGCLWALQPVEEPFRQQFHPPPKVMSAPPPPH